MDKVQCEILGLSSNPATGGAYAILLKEVVGARRLPIIIGAFEAQAIALEMEGIKPPRPLTHDPLKTLVDNLGANVVEVIVSELKDNTFFAKIVLEASGLSNEIDARPSDAIALAVRTYAPIYVNETVMSSAAFIPSDETDLPGFETINDADLDKKPLSKEAQLAVLQDKLREALENEEFERAAKLRDDIKRLTQNN